MATVGLFYVQSVNFSPWNVSGESAIAAIGGGMAIALFSYLGVEVAAVAAGKVKDPDRNIPRATILGTLATAVVYMLSLTAVFGILPASHLVNATAPFSDAINTMFGGTVWGHVMAIIVIISGFGALNGWTMICAEMPLAAANDGLFPEQFKRISSKGVPAFGIVASTLLASVAMAVNYLGSNGATVFTTLVLMTGITAVIPYAFSAAWPNSSGVGWTTRRFRHLGSCATPSLPSSRSCSRSCSSGTPETPATASSFTGRRSSWQVVRSCSAFPSTCWQRSRMTEPEPVPQYR